MAARATAQGLVAERAGHGGGNPYHDELGKFTTKGGAGSGGTKTAHTTSSTPFGEINMAPLPPGPRKRIIGAYNRIKAKYPQLRVDNVRVGDVMGGALAETWARPPRGPQIAKTTRGDHYIEIVLNESLADVVATGKAYADSVSTGFHPPAGPNNDCYDAIMIHELGHALTDKTNAVSRVEGELLKAFNEYNASASEENAYESFENWVYDNVSGYALDGNGRLNPSEALADAFEDVEMNGRLAKPGSKALHRMLEEELRRAAK